MSLDPIIRGAEIAAGVLAFIAIGAFIVCKIENWLHRDASFDS